MGRIRPSKDDEMSPKTTIQIPSDEEDANADLSLGILAKAKRKKRPEDSVLDIASSDDEVREIETPRSRTLVVDLEGEPDGDRGNAGVEASGDGVSLSQAITVEETGVAVLKENTDCADGEGGASEDKKKKKKKKKKQKTGKVETKSCRSKGKDKGGITAVPLEGNQMQTRLSRSKQINPGKEEGIPTRRKREIKVKD